MCGVWGGGKISARFWAQNLGQILARLRGMQGLDQVVLCKALSFKAWRGGGQPG